MYQKLLLILFLGIFTLNAQGQRTDRILIRLNTPEGSNSDLRLDIDPSTTEYFDLGYDSPVQYNPFASYFFTIWARQKEYVEGIIVPEEGEEEELAYLVADARPYAENYFVDFPLFLEATNSGKYTISKEEGRVYMNKAVFVRLIDKEIPDLIIDLDEGPYSFEQSANGKKNYEDRFTIRVYAASLFRTDALSSDWNDISNWIGLKNIPGVISDTDNRHNYCIVIPENQTVNIPSGDFTIGTLLNSGEIIINKEAVLTIEDGAHLISVKEFY